MSLNLTASQPEPKPSIAYMIGDPAKPTARVSFVLNGHWKSYLLASDQGQKITELLRQEPQDIEAIAELADIQTWIAQRSHGRVTVDEVDRLRLDGKLIDYGLTGRVGKIIEQGVSFEALANFIERVSRNPDPTVPEDLFRFMEKGNLPLDPQGYVLAFKKVDDDFNSFHTGKDGKVNYAPGSAPAMAREDCDPNRHQTCSRGLHACSFEYLKVWYPQRGRVVIVRIDPEHVTAIPADHDDQKLRCCLMEVMAEIPEEEARDHFQSVVDARYPAKDAAAADEALEELIEAVEATEPPTPVSNWHERGYDIGIEAGRQDKLNDYDYGPEMEGSFPEDMPQDARPAFCKGYIDGYEAGYQQARAAGSEDGESPTAAEGWDLERAQKEGWSRGTLKAEADHPIYENETAFDDHDGREALESWLVEQDEDCDTEEHELIKAFDRAFHDGYHSRFRTLDEGDAGADPEPEERF